MKGPTPVLSYRVDVLCQYQDDTMAFSVTDLLAGHAVDVIEPFRAFLCAFFSGKGDPRVIPLAGNGAWAKIPLHESHVRLFWRA